MVNSTAGKRPEPDLKYAVELVLRLMAVPGKSGEESGVADVVRTALRKAGLPASAMKQDSAHKLSPIGGEIGNLIVKLPGTIKAPRRMLSAHLDTVPICVGSKPVVKGGRATSADPKTGLGADNRAGTAVLVAALSTILRQKLPHPPLTFLWTVQEEVGLLGARHLNASMLGRPALGFNFDGGPAAQLILGATGAYRMEATLTGLASHAGVRPEAGVSAIAAASLAIARLHKGGWHGRIRKGKSSGTSNVGVVQAGQATNVVCDHAVVRAEMRSHDPKFRKQILKKFRQAFERAAAEVRNQDGESAKVHFTERLDYESFRLKKKEPCVLAARQAIVDIDREPVLAISDGGLDANWLTAHGVPTVTLGAGQQNIHTTREALDLDEFRAACRIALRLACGGS